MRSATNSGMAGGGDVDQLRTRRRRTVADTGLSAPTGQRLDDVKLRQETNCGQARFELSGGRTADSAHPGILTAQRPRAAATPLILNRFAPALNFSDALWTLFDVLPRQQQRLGHRSAGQLERAPFLRRSATGNTKQALACSPTRSPPRATPPAPM